VVSSPHSSLEGSSFYWSCSCSLRIFEDTNLLRILDETPEWDSQISPLLTERFQFILNLPSRDQIPSLSTTVAVSTLLLVSVAVLVLVVLGVLVMGFPRREEEIGEDL
jgi:hypothetical protein